MRISVICPVYNTPPELLRAAAQSVIDAAGPHLHELILVDDVSTAAQTVQAIEQIAVADRRVMVVRPPGNGGRNKARNLGIRAATGDWIGFIDHDDLWLPGRVEPAIAVLDAFPEAKWIGGNYASLYRDGGTEAAPLIAAACPGCRLSASVVRLQTPALTRTLIGNAWLHLGASLIDKKLLESIGGFYEVDHYLEDCILFARLSTVADLFFIESELYLWRRDIDSLMASPARLTDIYAAGWVRTRTDALLHSFRRELRWTLYGTYKGLALNNLLNGFHRRALRFALKAVMLDPRELREFLLFLRLMARRDPRKMRDQEWNYTRAERFIVEPR